MGQERRSFGSIERRSGYFRARYVGPDRQRYDAPHLFSERIDAEFWLGEVHRLILREAEGEGLIDRNPCRVRNAGKVRRACEMEPATPAELNKLLDLPPKQGLPVVLAGWCGLRSGKCVGRAGVTWT